MVEPVVATRRPPLVWALPRPHISRPRLVTRIGDADRPVALEGAGGYGKTTLAVEVAHAHPGPVLAVRLDSPGTDRAALWRATARAARRAGLSDIARRLAPDADPDEAGDDLHHLLTTTTSPVLVILDEVQALEDDAARWLVDLVDPLQAGLRLVLAGRRLPEPLERLAERGTIERITVEDLRFDDDEVRRCSTAVTGSDGGAVAAAEVRRRTEGWPALVALVTSEHGEVADGARSLGAMVDRHLVALTAEDRAALAAAAHLPYLHPDLDSALGTAGLLERAMAAGLPLARRPDGWWELAGPVAEHLRGAGRLDPAVARRVADRFAVLGAPVVAARLLVANGENDDAAEQVTRWSRPEVEGGDPGEVAALVTSIPDDNLGRHPRSLLVASWAHHALGEFLEQRRLLDRARTLVETGTELGREVDAEWAWANATDQTYEPSIAVAQAVLATAEDHEVSSRSRALAALGIALANRPDGAGSREAQRASHGAIQLFLDQGQVGMAAEALLYLGYHQLFQEGRFDEAEGALRRALTLVPGRSRLRARLTVFLAEVLLGRGDHEGAGVLLDEGLYLATSVGNRQLQGYVAWLRLELASRHGDRKAVLEALGAVEAVRGEWYEHTGGGALFLCEATVAAARVDIELAATLLERLRRHPARVPIIEQVAGAALAARLGDHATVLAALGPTADLAELPRRLEWWAALVRATAYRAAGEEAAVERELRTMAVAAAALGLPDLPALVEPQLVAALVPPPAAADEQEPAPVEVQLLGRFGVRAGDAELDLPPGQPTRLVQLVAVTGRVTIESVLDALWPDEADPTVARKRLRNVLHRIRTTCPDLVHRDGEQLVRGPAVRTDLDDFTTAVSEARDAGASGGDAVGPARAALVRYEGDLLADSPGEEWVAARREAERVRLLGVLELLIDAAIADDDVDEAIRLSERAIEADPLDDDRYLTVAGLLLDRGRLSGARAMLERAAAVRADLALPPSRAHAALVSRLEDAVRRS